MRAAVYARVSHDPKGLGRSVTEQVAECRAWAEQEGWDVVEEISETGSASRYARSSKARQRWSEVVELVASGRIDILLTWEHSRANRTLEEYTDLRNLCATHGVLWGYTGAVYDLTKRDARFRTGIDALLAEDESERTSERIRRNVRARAVAGAPHGKLPYGYRREYDANTGALLRQVPDDATAPIAREVIERVAGGETLYAIAADLTDRGIAPPRPGRGRPNPQAWIPTTVRRIASSPTYVAQRVHRGEVVGPATWPALVDDETWERAQAALEQMTKGAPRVDRSVKWLLSGIARCGLPGCGGPMVRTLNRGSSSYTCRLCGRVNRLQEPVDQVVVERLLRAVASYDGPTSDEARPELAAAEAEVAALHQRLDSLIDQGADGSISPATLARIESRLLPKIKDAERSARALRRPAALTDYDGEEDPQVWWDRLTLARRRAVLAGTVDVTIHPACRGRRTFNADLIEVRPRW